jgi:hypothetical protein
MALKGCMALHQMISYGDMGWEIDHSYKEEAPFLLRKYCLTCNKVASFKCQKCQRAYYCSKQCQVNNWQKGHKYVCFPRLSDLLLKCFDLHVTQAERQPYSGYSKSNVFLPSVGTLTIVEGNCYAHMQSLLSRHGHDFCVVCGREPTFQDNYLKPRTFSFIKNHKIVHCHRCEVCDDAKKEICPLTFRDKDECRLLASSQIRCFIMCALLSKNDILSTLPRELVTLIALTMNALGCIRH